MQCKPCCLQNGVVKSCGRLLWRSSKPSKSQQAVPAAAPDAAPALPAAPPPQYLPYPVAYPYPSWGAPQMFPVSYAAGGPQHFALGPGGVQMMATTEQQAFNMPPQLMSGPYYQPRAPQDSELQQYVYMGNPGQPAFGVPPQSPPATFQQQVMRVPASFQGSQLQQYLHVAAAGPHASSMPPRSPPGTYVQWLHAPGLSTQDSQPQLTEYQDSPLADSNLPPYAHSDYGGLSTTSQQIRRA